METTVINGMCRCCASEGAFKDIKRSYQWMGDEEVYGEMLKECFDIDLSATEDSDGSICEVCITQLRNACNFKKQVLQTEDHFKKQLQIKFFKPTVVKVEMQDENNQSDDNISLDDGFSGPEFDMPIKKEGTEESKPKKRAAAAKASTSRAKKSKANDESADTSTTKRTQPLRRIKQLPEVLIMGQKVNIKAAGNTGKLEGVQSAKHLVNIREILKCTNATPIGQYHLIGFSCCYCNEKFKQPNELKKHTLATHRHATHARFMKKSLRDFQVNLDITLLKCELCHDTINSIEEVIRHLKERHAKNTATDIENHIVPFKFDSEVFNCCVCSTEFSNYKQLLMHMHVHYRNYECEICGVGFVSAHNLHSHKLTHKKGEFTCGICTKVFNSDQKRKKHEKSHFDANNHKCPYCVQGFSNNRKRNEHMARVHGIPLPIYPCKACGKTFTDTTPYRRHLKRDHLMEKPHDCKLCSKSFFSARLLREHMISHSGERNFQCDVCLKSYGRKTTLIEHMRIHNNDRRFKCEHCGQAFVQKCSWKSHMRSKHGEDI